MLLIYKNKSKSVHSLHTGYRVCIHRPQSGASVSDLSCNLCKAFSLKVIRLPSDLCINLNRPGLPRHP